MKEDLKIDSDYGSIFGLDCKKSQQLIYLGGIRFRAVKGDRQMEVDSQDSYDKIHEYINRPAIHMGRM